MAIKKMYMPLTRDSSIIHESIVCDLCGLIYAWAERQWLGVRWGPDPSQPPLVAVEYHASGEDGHFCVVRTSYHICVSCFQEKVVAWLQSEGAIATVERFELDQGLDRRQKT